MRSNLMRFALPRLRHAHILFGVFICALTACDNSEPDANDQPIIGDPTPEQLAELEANTTLSSGFGSVKSDGTFEGSATTIFKGGFQDDAGNGYAYELGRNETAFTAKVGLLEETDVGDLPNSGLATLHGGYQIAQVGKSQGDTRKYGESEVIAGRISLRADFVYGTLEGSHELLIIDGTFSGSTLSGTAYFDGSSAELSGLMGGERAVGVFHGTNDASAFVGGFLVER